MGIFSPGIIKQRLATSLSLSAWRRKLGHWKAALTFWPPITPGMARVVFDAGKAKNCRLCLFSSYSHGRAIGGYVWRYIYELATNGMDLIFLSASTLQKEDRDRLASFCRIVVEKENVCPDFSAWKIGLDLTGNAREYESVLLANDSVFGPLLPLAPIITKMQARDYGFWGLTNGRSLMRNLQSYFLWANRPALDHPAWAKFWDDVRAVDNKRLICSLYEMGLSKALAKAGVRLGVFADADDVLAADSDNPMNFFDNTPIVNWRALILSFGFPFLKRGLFGREIREVMSGFSRRIAKNFLASLAGWRGVVAGCAGYPAALIEEEVSRMPGGMLPE